VKRGLAAALLAALLSASPAPADTPQDPLLLETFRQVWSTVRDRVPQLEDSGLDWERLRTEYEARVRHAEGADELRSILAEMLAELGQSHLAILPGRAAEAVIGAQEGASTGPLGDPGLSVRVLEGEAVVVDVAPDGAAAAAGLAPGWLLRSVDGEPLAPLLADLASTYDGSTLRDLMSARAVMGRLEGARGVARTVVAVDGEGTHRNLTLTLGAPRGELARFGRLPPTPVWVTFERLEGPVGRLAFNAFLDPARLMPAFESAVEACRDCSGMVLDLRGNSGGIAAMAMGLAGWFVSEPDHRLGTMKTPDATVRFAIFPRAEPYTGPLAILVDKLTASTAEILAGGLQDIGRARVFGTRTAGAALPSVIHRLPNGDAFQFPVASYRSADGAELEGRGVVPDEPVALEREALLAGRDPVLEAATAWIRSEAPAGAAPPPREESPQ
jgi:carboxyl-terminal processing protease